LNGPSKITFKLEKELEPPPPVLDTVRVATSELIHRLAWSAVL